MNYLKILDDFFYKSELFSSNRTNLIVILGSFADFDSFEYAQQISDIYEKLVKHSVNLSIVGIGSEKSKKYFCNFNNLDPQNVIALSNSELHMKLRLNSGLNSSLPSVLNLLLMCCGIQSKGTIKEVIRGYTGDRNSPRIFLSSKKIKIAHKLILKGNIFDIISKGDNLRPFELATRRLINMIEILSNWNIYMPDSSFATQRGATFLINEKNEIIYSFFAESLLGYAYNMNSPLSFLDDLLT